MKTVLDSLLDAIERIVTIPFGAWKISLTVLAFTAGFALIAQLHGAPQAAKAILIFTAALLAMEALGLIVTAISWRGGGEYADLSVWLFGGAAVVVALIAAAFAWWGLGVGGA